MADYVNRVQSHIKRLTGTLDQVKALREKEVLALEDELALSLALEQAIRRGAVPENKLDLLFKIMKEAP